MNAEHELKVHVERIVRPIRASEKDKLQMREELFAHALDAFKHERSEGADEAMAARRAVERLGEIEATRQELQATIGWQSRNAHWNDRMVRRPQGMSLLRHARNLALRTSVIFFAYLVVLLVPLRWEDLLAWNSEGQLLARIMLVMTTLMGSGMFFASLLGSFGWRLADRHYQRRGDYAKAVGLLLVSATTVCLHGWAFTYFISFDIAASFRIMQWWLYLSLPIALMAAVVPYLDVKERRPLAEWLELDLAE